MTNTLYSTKQCNISTFISCFNALIKVRVKLKNLADLDFDLDPNWGITPNIETLYFIET